MDLHERAQAQVGSGPEGGTSGVDKLITDLLGEIEYLRTELDMTRARLERLEQARNEDASSG